MAPRMVGLNGIVIKSHGGADFFGFQRAIEVAVMEARNGVPAKHRAGTGRGPTKGLKDRNVFTHRRHRQLSAGRRY